MAGFPFELVSPVRLVFSGDVEQVDVPGAEGDFGVLAGHAPFVSTLRPGVLTIHESGSTKRYFVREGFAEVNAKGLTVLAETAVPADELDREALAIGHQGGGAARFRGQGRGSALESGGSGRAAEGSGRADRTDAVSRPLAARQVLANSPNSLTTCS